MGGACHVTSGSGRLTRSFSSHQILALGLVWVDGGDSDVVVRVWVQVFQDVGGLIAGQDGLMGVGRKTEIQSTYLRLTFTDD